MDSFGTEFLGWLDNLRTQSSNPLQTIVLKMTGDWGAVFDIFNFLISAKRGSYVRIDIDPVLVWLQGKLPGLKSKALGLESSPDH